MSSSHESRLTSQIHLDIEDHMTINVRIANRSFPIFWKLKGWHHILHFSFDSSSPKIGPRSRIDSQSFFHTMRELDPVFVGMLPITRLHLTENSVALPKNVTNLPRKSGFLCYLVRNSILRYLHRKGIFQFS